MIAEHLRAFLAPEITRPVIEPVPSIYDQELPGWMREERIASDGLHFALQGGKAHSSDYLHETLSGNHGGEVVTVSNGRFKNAPGWGQLEEWLGERLEIAKAPEYRDRSTYWISRRLSESLTPLVKPLAERKTETTYGMTWGEYSREDIEGKTDEEIYKNLKIRLPEEKTLQKPIHRYFDSNGKGIVIEFRAVSKDPNTTPTWLRDDGLNQMILGILNVAKRYPELYDKPIVSCYADERTIPLYEHWMNMKIQNETTPLDQPAFIHRKDGTIDQRVSWHYIEVSPRDLERVLIERTRGARTLRDLNQAHPFKLPDGREAIAKAKAPISFDSNENVTWATLESATELQSGIVAQKGASAFWVDKHLVRVSAIQDPYTFQIDDKTSVFAPIGATLEWDHPYLTGGWLASKYLPDLDEHYKRQSDDFVYLPHFEEGKSGIKELIQGGDYLDLFKQAESAVDRLGKVSAEERPRRLLEARAKLVNPKIARIVSSSDHPIILPDLGIRAVDVQLTEKRFEPTLVARLAEDFTTEDGVKAATGSDLVLTRNNDKWVWNRIALAEDCDLDGISFKKGMVLIRNETGIRAYDGVGHFKDYPANGWTKFHQ